MKNKYLCSPQLVPGKHEAWDVNSYLFHTSKHISSFLLDFRISGFYHYLLFSVHSFSNSVAFGERPRLSRT